MARVLCDLAPGTVTSLFSSSHMREREREREIGTAWRVRQLLNAHWSMVNNHTNKNEKAVH